MARPVLLPDCSVVSRELVALVAVCPPPVSCYVALHCQYTHHFSLVLLYIQPVSELTINIIKRSFTDKASEEPLSLCCLYSLSGEETNKPDLQFSPSKHSAASPPPSQVIRDTATQETDSPIIPIVFPWFLTGSVPLSPDLSAPNNKNSDKKVC